MGSGREGVRCCYTSCDWFTMIVLCDRQGEMRSWRPRSALGPDKRKLHWSRERGSAGLLDRLWLIHTDHALWETVPVKVRQGETRSRRPRSAPGPDKCKLHWLWGRGAAGLLDWLWLVHTDCALWETVPVEDKVTWDPEGPGQHWAPISVTHYTGLEREGMLGYLTGCDRFTMVMLCERRGEGPGQHWALTSINYTGLGRGLLGCLTSCD